MVTAAATTLSADARTALVVSAEDVKAMMEAARDGDTEALESLLKTDGARIHARDRDGQTSLIVAVASGQEHAADALLAPTRDAGLLDAQCSSQYGGRSALMWACRRGLTGLVQKLLELDSNVELTDEEGITALLLAVAHGHEEAAKLLVSPTRTAGASLDTQHALCGRSAFLFSSTDKHGATALMLAIQHATVGNEALVDILISPTREAGMLDQQDAVVKRSALHGASARGLLDTVRKLLALNANPGLSDTNGSTPLLLAFVHGHPAAANVLLVPSAQAGVLDVKGKFGMSALCRACEQGHAGLVERLLDQDANPKMRDGDVHGNTPLMLAIANGHAAVAEILLSRERQVAALDVQSTGAKRSAIMIASDKGQAELVGQLLGLGAKVGLRDKYGKTALILALEKGHEAVAEMLLPPTARAGALDVQGSGMMDRKSALMISSKKGLTGLVDKLLLLRANAQLKDAQGKTALDLARESNRDACVSLLTLHASSVGRN